VGWKVGRAEKEHVAPGPSAVLRSLCGAEISFQASKVLILLPFKRNEKISASGVLIGVRYSRNKECLKDPNGVKLKPPSKKV